MKNKIKLLLILVVIIPVFSMFAPANAIFTNTICAGTTVDAGVKCVDNSTKCPTGFTLAKEYFSTLDAKEMRTAQISQAFVDAYGADALRTLCLTNSLKTFIPVYTATHAQDDGPDGQNIHQISESGSPALDTVRVARACPTGWHADQGNYTFTTLGIGPSSWRNPWGCCPTGYNFVNVKSQSFPDGEQVGACVKASIPADYLNTECGGTGQCPNGFYDSSGNNIIDFDASATYSQFSSWDDLKNAIGNVDYIYSYTNSAGNIVQPVQGIGLGRRFLDLDLDGLPQRVKTGPTPTGAPLICPTNTACAIKMNPAQGAKNPDMTLMVNANSFSQAGNTDVCSRCYTAGDTVGTSSPPNPPGIDSPQAGVDNSIGFVRFCNADGSFRDETLLGTPDITRGYLLEDATNKALYDQCFSTGGIYTAIGCIDPTPTGIITGLIRIALGIMGGVALLQLIYVGILYQQGDQEKIKGARTQLIATITGVAVLVFSVLILRIIGVNILDVVSNGSV